MNEKLALSRRTALVLGGGGSAGNAWLIGVIAGLADAGVVVANAELIVGTSAGATAAAQITSAPASRLYTDILDAVVPLRGGGGDSRRGAMRPSMSHLEVTNAIIAESSGPGDMRRRIGAEAIRSAHANGSEGTERWRTMVAARLPSQDWPQQKLALTAVDATAGEPVVFTNDTGVELVDAVSASTAGGPAFRIGARWFIDGGYRTNADNADLAARHARVLVLSPLGGRTRLPAAWGLTLSDQVRELRARGSDVQTVFPDEPALEAFGDNLMDLSRRRPTAEAGFAQGRALASSLGEWWTG